MARDLVLLANPAAGKGRGARGADAVASRLRAGGFNVDRLVADHAEQAATQAEEAVRSGVGSLVCMGGDGMVHLGLQAVAASETTLGVIATGTGNDVARALDLPRGDPLRAADLILASWVRRVDLGEVQGTYFATVLATGFDSKVNERANTMRWPHGQMRYNLATVSELSVFTPLRYNLEIDGDRLELDAMLVAVGNGPSYGGGLRITHGARIDDGRLDVVIIKPLSKLELLWVYPKLFSGKHVTHRQYEHHFAEEVSLAALGIVAYADGERVGPLPTTVRVAPNALRVYAPRSLLS
ncbi:MAG: YegS/Rv2252/BmrU family lipid kinase [Nocardioidaceae bacterium]